MITLNEQLIKYCEANQIFYPPRKLRAEIGRFVSFHFKNRWGILQSAEIISEAGFVLGEEDGKKMILVGYPDSFGDEMLIKIDEIHKLKKEAQEIHAQKMLNQSEVKIPAEGEKKRPRKTTSKTPVFSTKKS